MKVDAAPGVINITVQGKLADRPDAHHRPGAEEPPHQARGQRGGLKNSSIDPPAFPASIRSGRNLMRISCTTSAARHREAVKARGIAVVLFVAPMLTGCARTVEWDEDVVLNTGESVVVHRMDLYKRRSEPGNPFNFEWWPTSRGYQFQYRGRRFTYKVPRTDSPGALALHRDPDGTISIVDYSRNCQKPGFARWKLRGDEWVFVPNVAAPLHGTARNLMAWQSPDGDIPPHVTAATRARLDAQAHTASHVDELYSLTAASDCTGKR